MQPLIPLASFHPLPHSPLPANLPARDGAATWATLPGQQSAVRDAAVPSSGPSHTAMVVASVLGLHIAFIWALQSGLLMHVAEIIVPAEMLAQFVAPVAALVPLQPEQKPLAPTPPKPATPQKQATSTSTAPSTPRPQRLAIDNTTSSANAPVGVVAQPTAAAAPAAPVADSLANAPAKIEQPMVDARYSDQDQTIYPAMSRRLGEQGISVLRVLIGTDGTAISAQLVKSSGFERLDKAAYDTVMRRRYIPGTQSGVPVARSYNAPIAWVLK